MQAPAMPPNEKSVAISDIATILGLLQHFSGIETGSKFSSGSKGVTALFACGLINRASGQP